MGCSACGHTQDAGRFCGRCGALIVLPADEPEERGEHRLSGVGGSPPPPPRRRDAPRRLPAAVVAVLLLTAAALASSIAGDPAPGTRESAPAAGDSSSRTGNVDIDPEGEQAPFRTATEALALVEDGGSGLTVVDLDTGRRHARVVDEQRRGDQPYRLWPLGSWIAVGWGEIWAVGPDDPGSSRLLGEASYFVPGSEPEHLWLIDRPDWRGDDGPGTWTLIDHAGTVLHRGAARAGYDVERGVPGGLAVRGEDAVLRRYEPETETITEFVGGPDAQLLAVHRGGFLWCESDCTALQLTDDVRTREVTAEDVHAFLDAWVAPDGSAVAAHVAVETPEGARDFQLRMYDAEEGRELAAVAVQLGDAHAAWTPDGAQLLYRVASAPGPSTFGRYTRAGFEEASHDPLEGLPPGRFLVGHASWYPTIFEDGPEQAGG